jgi:hypothetical protein
MKKKTSKRKTTHEPIPATFDDILGAIAGSKYKNKKTLKKKRSK